MKQKEILYFILMLLFVFLYLYGAGVIISWAIGGALGVNVKWYFGTILYVFFGNTTDLASNW